MRDDSQRWEPPAERFDFVVPGVRALEVDLPESWMISGPGVLEQFAAHYVSWPDVVDVPAYAVALRRDRILWIGPWDHGGGYDPSRQLAVSDVSDAFAVIDLSGPHALDLLRHGTELRLDKPSRSVSRLIFGIEVLLYRVTSDQHFRLHVPRASAIAFRRNLIAGA